MNFPLGDVEKLKVVPFVDAISCPFVQGLWSYFIALQLAAREVCFRLFLRYILFMLRTAEANSTDLAERCLPRKFPALPTDIVFEVFVQIFVEDSVDVFGMCSTGTIAFPLGTD